jgi:hypothetical protein
MMMKYWSTFVILLYHITGQMAISDSAGLRSFDFALRPSPGQAQGRSSDRLRTRIGTTQAQDAAIAPRLPHCCGVDGTGGAIVVKAKDALKSGRLLPPLLQQWDVSALLLERGLGEDDLHA